MARSASLALPLSENSYPTISRVMAVDDGGQVTPAVIAAMDVGDVYGSGAHQSGRRWRPDPDPWP